MQITVDFVHVACEGRPRGDNLHATGGHSGTIYMQSRQFFASTLHEQLFELKNEYAIKKSEKLRHSCAC
jgi:hypothetical protein